MSTQWSRKPRSEQTGPKAAHRSPSLSHACHLAVCTGLPPRLWVLDLVTWPEPGLCPQE